MLKFYTTTPLTTYKSIKIFMYIYATTIQLPLSITVKIIFIFLDPQRLT